jgi:hypothetical protein
MAEARSTGLIYALQAANPRNLNMMWDLGVDLCRHFDLLPFNTVGAENPVVSVDAATALMKLVLGKTQPHLFMSLNGLMNPGSEFWRAEIGWPRNSYRGKGKSPALALCTAILRAHEGSVADREDKIPAWLQTEAWQDDAASLAG